MLDDTIRGEPPETKALRDFQGAIAKSFQERVVDRVEAGNKLRDWSAGNRSQRRLLDKLRSRKPQTVPRAQPAESTALSLDYSPAADEPTVTIRVTTTPRGRDVSFSREGHEFFRLPDMVERTFSRRAWADMVDVARRLEGLLAEKGKTGVVPDLISGRWTDELATLREKAAEAEARLVCELASRLHAVAVDDAAGPAIGRFSDCSSPSDPPGYWDDEDPTAFCDGVVATRGDGTRVLKWFSHEGWAIVLDDVDWRHFLVERTGTPNERRLQLVGESAASEIDPSRLAGYREMLQGFIAVVEDGTAGTSIRMASMPTPDRPEEPTSWTFPRDVYPPVAA